MFRGARALACALFAIAPVPTLAASPDPMKVSTSPAFFNPSLGREGRIRVDVGESGDVIVEILDRDRYVVRKIGPTATTGSVEIAWDGKDDRGQVVPDEAYAVRVQFMSSSGRKRIFDPGEDREPEPVAIEQFSYSRVDGVLNYKLPKASRVHIQAGQARRKSDGSVEGPILRTVVDRAPRSGGAVSEQWTGFDESRTVYIPDLPSFVVAILASPLPDGSLITIGNRKTGFVEYAKSRKGMTHRPVSRHTTTSATHHRGLAGPDDRSPAVRLARSGAQASWTLEGEGALQFEASIPPELSPVYLRPGAKLLVFRDLEQVLALDCSSNPCGVSLPLESIPPGSHRLSVNWDSGRGPVGVGLALVERK